MTLEPLIFSIALIWLIAASIFDIKIKEVPDWLNFSLIIIAFFIHLIYSLYTNTFTIFFYALMGFLFYFLVGNMLYIFKQWGGGDAKLLMGLGMLIPIYPEFLLKYFNPNLNIPFLVILLINILIIGGIYGIFMAIYYAIRNKKEFVKSFKSIIRILKKQLMLLLLIFIFPILSLLFFEEFFVMTLLVSILVIIIPLLFMFVKAVENVSMYKKINVNKLREGDWIPKDIKRGKKIIYKSKFSGVTKKDIKLLKKHKIKSVIIKEGFAFVPAFLLGFIISIIFGNFVIF